MARIRYTFRGEVVCARKDESGSPRAAKRPRSAMNSTSPTSSLQDLNAILRDYGDECASFISENLFDLEYDVIVSCPATTTEKAVASSPSSENADDLRYRKTYVALMAVYVILKRMGLLHRWICVRDNMLQLMALPLGAGASRKTEKHNFMKRLRETIFMAKGVKRDHKLPFAYRFCPAVMERCLNGLGAEEAVSIADQAMAACNDGADVSTQFSAVFATTMDNALVPETVDLVCHEDDDVSRVDDMYDNRINKWFK